ncbi:hypothetical protein NUG22_38845, partial [Saccharothrix longispora]|nr:hypothetical protein [Saccharothrix longispora]
SRPDGGPGVLALPAPRRVVTGRPGLPGTSGLSAARAAPPSPRVVVGTAGVCPGRCAVGPVSPVAVAFSEVGPVLWSPAAGALTDEPCWPGRSGPAPAVSAGPVPGVGAVVRGPVAGVVSPTAGGAAPAGAGDAAFPVPGAAVVTASGVGTVPAPPGGRPVLAVW